jgi:hypothetical protein
VNLLLETLLRLFQHLEPFIQSRDSKERERSILSAATLLKKFIELFGTTATAANTSAVSEQQASTSSSASFVGGCIAMLIPRCTDPLLPVRQTALVAIQHVICILLLLSSLMCF